MAFQIRPALQADRPVIKAACHATFDEHRERQPFAYRRDVWKQPGEKSVKHTFQPEITCAIRGSINLSLAGADGSGAGYVAVYIGSRDQVLRAKAIPWKGFLATLGAMGLVAALVQV